jgi:hypothetical protein
MSRQSTLGLQLKRQWHTYKICNYIPFYQSQTFQLKKSFFIHTEYER